MDFIKEIWKGVKDLWRGDVKLVYTFWIFGVLVFLILVVWRSAVEVSILVDPDNYIPPGKHTNLFNWTYIPLYLCYTVFATVSIWRSSTKNQGSYAWKILAKLFTIYLLILACKNGRDFFEGLKIDIQ